MHPNANARSRGNRPSARNRASGTRIESQSSGSRSSRPVADETVRASLPQGFAPVDPPETALHVLHRHERHSHRRVDQGQADQQEGEPTCSGHDLHPAEPSPGPDPDRNPREGNRSLFEVDGDQKRRRHPSHLGPRRSAQVGHERDENEQQALGVHPSGTPENRFGDRDVDAEAQGGERRHPAAADEPTGNEVDQGHTPEVDPEVRGSPAPEPEVRTADSSGQRRRTRAGCSPAGRPLSRGATDPASRRSSGPPKHSRRPRTGSRSPGSRRGGSRRDTRREEHRPGATIWVRYSWVAEKLHNENWTGPQGTVTKLVLRFWTALASAGRCSASFVAPPAVSAPPRLTTGSRTGRPSASSVAWLPGRGALRAGRNRMARPEIDH